MANSQIVWQPFTPDADFFGGVPEPTLRTGRYIPTRATEAAPTASEQLAGYSSFDRDGRSGSQFFIGTPQAGVPVPTPWGPAAISGRYQKGSRTTTPEALGISKEFLQFLQERGISVEDLREKSSAYDIGMESNFAGGIFPRFIEDVIRPQNIKLTYGQSQSDVVTPFGEEISDSGISKSAAGRAQILSGMLGEDAPSVWANLNQLNGQTNQWGAGVDVPMGDGRVSGRVTSSPGDTYFGANVEIPLYAEGGIASLAQQKAIEDQTALRAAIAEGEPPPGEVWPSEEQIPVSELLNPSWLPGGSQDPLLDPDRPRTPGGEPVPVPVTEAEYITRYMMRVLDPDRFRTPGDEPVPVTEAEYIMRESGKHPPPNYLAIIGRDEALTKTATTDLSKETSLGWYLREGGHPLDYDYGKVAPLYGSDRPYLADDPGGSVVVGTDFDTRGTPTHEWMHAGLDQIRNVDPDFELPKFPSKYRVDNEEMWVRLIHNYTEDLSSAHSSVPLIVDGELQFEDNGDLKRETVTDKERDDRFLLGHTEGDTTYWLSQPSVRSAIESILARAGEVGRESGILRTYKGSTAVMQDPGGYVVQEEPYWETLRRRKLGRGQLT